MNPTMGIKRGHIGGLGGKGGGICAVVDEKEVVGRFRGFLKYNGLISNSRKSPCTQAVGMNGPEIVMSSRVA